MDLEALRIFVKVAELRSFTRAGEQLGLSKSRVSTRIEELEVSLGSRLLLRSTRAVQPTPDGEAFLVRARRLLLDAEDLGSMFQVPRTLRGRVRLDLPVSISRDLIIPRLPELLAAHPQLSLQLSTTDRRVDVVRDGFDCVLRVGPLRDSRLTARKLGALAMVSCASPAYLARFGVPLAPKDLTNHLLVHYEQTFGASPPAFEYWDGTRYASQPMRANITVNSAEAYAGACLAGLGIIQAPRVGMERHLAAGSLVSVLEAFPCEPMPVSLVHGHAQSVPKRVRAVMSFLAQ
ncbi:MAG: hypothetical protein RL385_2416, partial [Pseudomonadota bacterium]